MVDKSRTTYSVRVPYGTGQRIAYSEDDIMSGLSVVAGSGYSPLMYGEVCTGATAWSPMGIPVDHVLRDAFPATVLVASSRAQGVVGRSMPDAVDSRRGSVSFRTMRLVGELGVSLAAAYDVFVAKTSLLRDLHETAPEMTGFAGTAFGLLLASELYMLVSDRIHESRQAKVDEAMRTIQESTDVQEQLEALRVVKKKGLDFEYKNAMKEFLIHCRDKEAIPAQVIIPIQVVLDEFIRHEQAMFTDFLRVYNMCRNEIVKEVLEERLRAAGRL